MHRAQRLAPQEQLTLVDRFFDDRERPAQDRDRSQWQTLSDVLRTGGEGADIAVAKYFALRQLGFGSETMRVVVSYDAQTQMDKAVLAVLVDGDARELTARRKRGHAPVPRDLAVAYAVNENFWWDHALFGGTRRDSKSL